MGIIYDLFYTNLLFFNASLFFLVALLSSYIYKNYEVTYIRLIIYAIIIIACYEIATGTLLFIFQLVPINVEKVLYKITHSLLLNIIYIECIFFILNRIPKKYKKISIN